VKQDRLIEAGGARGNAVGNHAEFDYDWLVIGSGFGGSVSVLRLAEKGYSIGVLEAGRRFRDEDFARTTLDSRNCSWAPALGMRGILRMTTFKDVFISSGTGVGGGSLVYDNTLYRAADDPRGRDAERLCSRGHEPHGGDVSTVYKFTRQWGR
jgi:choline dehydrogenase-like flavoprotein